MVKEMLDFSRPLQLQKSKEDIGRIIAESVAIVGSSANARRVRITSATAREVPAVSIDSDRFEQVLVNLLMNAIQASPEGEEVTVTSFAEGPRLIIDVKDCGCGIPLDKRTEIFEPFMTTKKEGTGLGLPIAKKVVEAHGGQMEVMDNKQAGVTFRIRIPL